MLAWVMNMGFAASDSNTPPPVVNAQLSTLIILGTCIPLAVLILG